MMEPSARNQIKGKITEVVNGQTTGDVHIGGSVRVHASIINEAMNDLAMRVGNDAWAAIKRRSTSGCAGSLNRSSNA